MPSMAVEEKLSTCCIDILRKKFMGLQKLVYRSKIFKEEWITFAK
jgi:hypothetical protein